MTTCEYTEDARTPAQVLADKLNALPAGEHVLKAPQTEIVYGIAIRRDDEKDDLNLIHVGFMTIGYDHVELNGPKGIAFMRDTGTFKFAVAVLAAGDYLQWEVH